MSRDNPAQSKAFIEKAREIDADGEKSVAEDLLGRLARSPPERREQPTKDGKE